MTINPSTLVDLSHKLDFNVQIYPGDPLFSCTPHTTVAKDGYSVHTLTLGSHTGTHIDAPSHFFPEGQTIDQIPLSSLFKPLVVVDLTSRELQDRQTIIWSDIEASAESMSPDVVLVLRTGWSAFWGTPRYFSHPFLSRDAAAKIFDRGVRVLGVDTLSPDETPYDGVGGEQGFGVHEVILGGGGVIAENLNLGGLTDHNMIALVPLNLEGCDGSPVRAFAWKD